MYCLTGLLALALTACTVVAQTDTGAEDLLPEEQQQPELAPISPSDVFGACCRRQRNIPEGCYRWCNYKPNGFSRSALDLMYFNRSPEVCPRTALGSYLFCAGANHDHQTKCTEAKVGATLAKDKCLALCDLRAGVTLNLSWDHLPCLNVLGRVRDVFTTQVQLFIDEGKYSRLQQHLAQQQAELVE